MQVSVQKSTRTTCPRSSVLSSGSDPEVVAVGKGRVNDKGDVFPLDVKAGEYVLIGKYSGTEIKLDGEEYLIIREEEVLGVAEGVRDAELAHA